MRNNKFILLFFCLYIFSSFSFIYADDSTDQQQSIPMDINNSTPVVVDITQLLNNNNTTEPDSTEPDLVEVLEPKLIKAEQTKQVVTPSDANGFKAVLLTVIGDYETVVTDYTYQNNSNYYSHSIEIEQDYAWICSAAMLGLITFCTFKIIGGLLCKQW